MYVPFCFRCSFIPPVTMQSSFHSFHCEPKIGAVSLNSDHHNCSKYYCSTTKAVSGKGLLQQESMAAITEHVQTIGSYCESSHNRMSSPLPHLLRALPSGAQLEQTWKRWWSPNGLRGSVGQEGRFPGVSVWRLCGEDLGAD